MSEEWEFKKRMEDMTPEELKERVERAWNWTMPKLTPVPFVGEITQEVTYKYPELTARCPVTGIQDLYTVTITFVPDKWVPELKTLKLYFMAFRDLPISHEHLQAKIYKEFKEQIEPEWLQVDLSVAVRGGIKTDIVYNSDSEEE